jgi:cytochrome b561
MDRNADRAASAPFAYDPRTIALHWATAVLVLLLWCAGQTIDFFPKGAPRVGVRSLHILGGVLLLALVLYRIWWRATQGRRLPEAERTGQQKVASMLHGVIYLLLLATAVLGVTNAWVRGDTLFGILTLPQFDPGNKGLEEQVADLHELAANSVFVVAILHAAMGVVHHVVMHDNVLRRMLPNK